MRTIELSEMVNVTGGDRCARLRRRLARAIEKGNHKRAARLHAKLCEIQAMQ